MGSLLSTPIMTDEMYLNELRLKRNKMVLDFHYHPDYIEKCIKVLDNEIKLVESRLRDRHKVANCTICLKAKPIPQGYSVCDECIVPVVAYHHSIIKQ